MLEETLYKALSLSRHAGSEGDLALRQWLMNRLAHPFVDDGNNIHQQVGRSRTLFTAHTDTVHSRFSHANNIFHQEGDCIFASANSVLGADDAAGVALLMQLIHHNVPGHYCFTFGEEIGGIGASWLAQHAIEFDTYDRAIAFDRRDTTHVITHQRGARCCSDAFADALARQLGHGYAKNPTGVYTDTAEFVAFIPECTNLSAGYFNEHTDKERLDAKHLRMLSKVVLDVDWEHLPVARDLFSLDE